MIKILDGVKETVSFDTSAKIMLYDNTDYEEYPVHWHTPIEMIMPIEGHYTVTCNDIPYDLSENEILFICPGVLHKMGAQKGRRLIFQLDLTQLQSLADLESTISLMQPAVKITGENSPAIIEECVKLFNDINEEYFGNAPLKNAAIVNKFLQILVLTCRNYNENTERFSGIKPSKQQEYYGKFLSICDYINLHCTEDITLEEIADRAGFSKYHFSRLFKEFSGTSFYKYLNVRRIAYAEKLLQDPSVNITEVAIKSGFNSISAFMRMFKIVRNCTPTQFRNLNDKILK